MLDVGLNGVSDRGGTALAQGLACNRALRELALHDNPLSAVAVRLLSAAVRAGPAGHCRGEGRHRLVRVTGLPLDDGQVRRALPRLLSDAEAGRLLRLRSPLDYVRPPD